MAALCAPPENGLGGQRGGGEKNEEGKHFPALPGFPKIAREVTAGSHQTHRFLVIRDAAFTDVRLPCIDVDHRLCQYGRIQHQLVKADARGALTDHATLTARGREHDRLDRITVGITNKQLR